MPLSYKNLINGPKLLDELGSGNLSKDAILNSIRSSTNSSAKYIKGYANDTAIEALANSLNLNKGLFKQAFGLENKELDAYDPYHISDAKVEDFWDIDGKEIQKTYDEDTNTFKRGLYSNPELGGYGQTDFWYEDPFYPAFELYFDDESPLFNSRGDVPNSLSNFINKYANSVDSIGYMNRREIWIEFRKVFFKLFENEFNKNNNNRLTNKIYYISKIEGLNNLNKKIINYGEDKITITLNEDVSMLSWYLSELYKNLVYSYRNQRYMFPENVMRFDMTIKINDVRSFQIPKSNNESSGTVPVNSNYLNKDLGYKISPKSSKYYTLHDCTFEFFESNNTEDMIEIGGFSQPIYTPQSLSFNIIYKSVSRYSKFPLILNSYDINPWDEYEMAQLNGENKSFGSKSNLFDNLDRISNETKPEKKSFLNKQLGKAAQTVANTALNYLDNLEAKLRNVRGSAVNSLIDQFRDFTNVQKIEPDNVYKPDFNNRTSVKNLGNQLASGLVNDLENFVKGSANF